MALDSLQDWNFPVDLDSLQASLAGHELKLLYIDKFKEGLSKDEFREFKRAYMHPDSNKDFFNLLCAARSNLYTYKRQVWEKKLGYKPI